MPGILDMTDPMLMAGLGLLSGNQRSPNPVNPLASMQNSLMNGQQMKAQLTNQQMQQQKFEQDQKLRALQMKQIQTQMAAPVKRDMYTGADGYKYYNDNPTERVNSNIQAKTSLPTGMRLNAAGTPEYIPEYLDGQAKLKAAGKTDVNVNLPQDFPYDIPKGFMPVDMSDPSKGVTPIPGSDKDELTPEQAAKVQMLQTAQDAYIEVKDLIYNDEGDIDRENLFNAKVGMPFSEGRDLGVRMETGIQAITRAETGAAMPDTEVDNTKKRFMPSPLDSEKTIKLKLELYEDFIGGSLKLIDPSGRFDSKRFESEMKKRKEHRVTPKNTSVEDLVSKYAK